MTLCTWVITPAHTSAYSFLRTLSTASKQDKITLSGQGASQKMTAYLEIVTVESEPSSEAFLTMLATEDVLRRDWDDPEEDAIWADL